MSFVICYSFNVMNVLRNLKSAVHQNAVLLKIRLMMNVFNSDLMPIANLETAGYTGKAFFWQKKNSFVTAFKIR